MKTVVYQSYRTVDTPEWIERCMQSVREWTRAKGWDYRFIGDEILDMTPGWYRDKAAGCLPVVTDLGRLVLARQLLADGYERTVWLDADVLVFDPMRLEINITEQYAFGLETWIQPAKQGGLKAFANVHNAVAVFTKNNSFLDFYIHACLSVVERAQSPMVPQMVGPKLLGMLHNVIGFQVIEDIGALSPMVLCDIAGGGGPALDLFHKETKAPLRSANLCASQEGRTGGGVEIGPDIFERVCARLLEAGRL